MSEEVVDAALVMSAASPRDEFAAMCRRVSPRLVGTLVLRCGDRALAEDIAQEALARAWRDWPRISDRPVEPWVYAVGFNLLRSWRRRVITARRHAPTLASVPAAGDDPDAALGLRAAVAALPDRQREAIALRYYADLSVRDTAAVMRCAEGTVRALTTQATTTLRERLGLAFTVEEDD